MSDYEKPIDEISYEEKKLGTHIKADGSSETFVVTDEDKANAQADHEGTDADQEVRDEQEKETI